MSAARSRSAASLAAGQAAAQVEARSRRRGCRSPAASRRQGAAGRRGRPLAAQLVGSRGGRAARSTAAASLGAYAVDRRDTTRCSSLAAAIPAGVENEVASSVGSQMPAALLRADRGAQGDDAERRQRDVRGVDGEEQRHRVGGHAAGVGLSRLSSIIALMPKGVAALPSPSMLAGDVHDHRAHRRMIGRHVRKEARHHRPQPTAPVLCSNPPSCTTRIMPSQKAIRPIRPMARVHGGLRRVDGGRR